MTYLQKQYMLGNHIIDAVVVDDLLLLARAIMGAPWAGLSIIDVPGHWFADSDQVARSWDPTPDVFCTDAICNGDVFSVSDLSQDKRSQLHPVLKSYGNVRFFASVNIHDANARKLGTLAVFDSIPRQLSPAQKLSLAALSRQVARILTSRSRDLTEDARSAELEKEHRQVQKMEAVGQLAGGIAHDFNNLLTVINGRSELLLQKHALSEKVKKEIQGILKTGERAATLTRQLLAFSRRQVLQVKVVDLNLIVADAEKMLSRLLPENILLRTNLASRLHSVVADPSQTDQVIVNLAVNARDAMPNGGVLTIETANVELDEAYTAMHPYTSPGNFVVLSVSDNGCGIPPSVRARIFEPFFTTKGSGKGTGLGLSTVYGIVKQSGGHIELYSEVGCGTTFKIYFPATHLPPAQPSRSSIPVQTRGGDETILLAEDEQGVRELAREVLEQYGYTVLMACNGTEGLRTFRDYDGPINLLITDVIMPEIGGPELARQVLELKPETKVLYISGYTDNAIVNNGVLASGKNYLQKPFTTDALVRKVRKVLDAHGRAGPGPRKPAALG